MEQNKSSAEEIDLLYYFKRLQGLGANYITVLRRNGRLFLYIFFAFALLGISMRFIIPKKYYTNALIISYNIPADFVMISSLESLTLDKNAGGLSRELGIPYEAARSVSSISAVRMDSAFKFFETDTTGSIIRINLKIKDTSLIQQVQDGISHYLETNPYSLKKRLTRQRMLESLKSELISKSKNLDSLKATGGNGIISRATDKGIVLEKAVNPVSINMLQLDYYKQLLEIDNSLDLLKTVEVVQPFLRNELESSPSYRLIFAYFLIAGFLIALLVTPVFGKK